MGAPRRTRTGCCSAGSTSSSTPSGARQAERLAAATGPVDRVIASPLQRTRQTAAAFDQQVEIDERLVELDYGDFDGRPFDEVPEGTWGRWRSDASFAPPGGESLHALGLRVRAFLDELTRSPGDETVALVSHVSPIKAAVAWALGAGDELTWRLYVAPASITRVEVTDRGVVLRTFNEASHLSGI